MTEAPDYQELADLLRPLGYTEIPSNFHGVLCGALCVIEPERLSVESLLAEAAEGLEKLGAEDHARLARLRDETSDDLQSTDMSFEPLLPDDAMPLSLRVDALAAWCGGFLYGLSSRRQLDLRGLTDEARETLRDFSEFTQAGFDASGDAETEENAYSELVEYVRVGAQLLFLEMRPRPPAADEPSDTVH
ncbi:UPF0149 family protein [Panacagrimonas sp.]|uniref:UPF0149 family protein n=1 Tax=Panacagrimonas sp. TaxID=2480088 RepID=UPI003B51D901